MVVASQVASACLPPANSSCCIVLWCIPGSLSRNLHDSLDLVLVSTSFFVWILQSGGVRGSWRVLEIRIEKEAWT